jgi:hypothetical protein
MNESEKRRVSLSVPCLVLQFLLSPQPRKKQPGMEEFSESANLHRLHSLLWTFQDNYAANLLSECDRSVLKAFEQAFASLPWQPIESHPHISELAGDDLSPLIEPGKRLLSVLDALKEK